MKNYFLQTKMASKDKCSYFINLSKYTKPISLKLWLKTHEREFHIYNAIIRLILALISPTT